MRKKLLIIFFAIVFFSFGLFWVDNKLAMNRMIFISDVISEYIHKHGRIPKNLYLASNHFHENRESPCDFWNLSIPGIGICFYSPWEDKYFIQVDSIFSTLVLSSDNNETMFFDPGL